MAKRKMIMVGFARIFAVILTLNYILLVQNVIGEEILEFEISLAKPVYLQGEEITVTTKLINRSDAGLEVTKPPMTIYNRIVTFKIAERNTDKVIPPLVKWSGTGTEGENVVIPAHGEIISSCDVAGGFDLTDLAPGEYWVQGYYQTDIYNLTSNKLFFTMKPMADNGKEAFEMYKSALMAGEREAVISKCLKMLQKFPNSIFAKRVYYLLADNYRGLKKYDKAIEILGQLLTSSLTPSQEAKIRWQLAWAYYKKGDKDKAVSEMNKLGTPGAKRLAEEWSSLH